MPEFRTVDAGHAKIRVAVEGQGPLVLMVHGFPESWYSYRHQIAPIAEAGFTACAIDVRGTTANASCRGKASYVGKVGSGETRTEARVWRFELRRDGDAWKIETAEARRP